MTGGGHENTPVSVDRAGEGVPGAGVWSPLGEWRDAAPAGRYSATAVIRPGGHITPTVE
jgi:hypothetical protein